MTHGLYNMIAAAAPHELVYTLSFRLVHTWQVYAPSSYITAVRVRTANARAPCEDALLDCERLVIQGRQLDARALSGPVAACEFVSTLVQLYTRGDPRVSCTAVSTRPMPVARPISWAVRVDRIREVVSASAHTVCT